MGEALVLVETFGAGGGSIGTVGGSFFTRSAVGGAGVTRVACEDTFSSGNRAANGSCYLYWRVGWQIWIAQWSILQSDYFADDFSRTRESAPCMGLLFEFDDLLGCHPARLVPKGNDLIV